MISCRHDNKREYDMYVDCTMMNTGYDTS